MQWRNKRCHAQFPNDRHREHIRQIRHHRQLPDNRYSPSEKRSGLRVMRVLTRRDRETGSKTAARRRSLELLDEAQQADVQHFEVRTENIRKVAQTVGGGITGKVRPLCRLPQKSVVSAGVGLGEKER